MRVKSLMWQERYWWGLAGTVEAETLWERLSCQYLRMTVYFLRFFALFVDTLGIGGK